MITSGSCPHPHLPHHRRVTPSTCRGIRLCRGPGPGPAQGRDGRCRRGGVHFTSDFICAAQRLEECSIRPDEQFHSAGTTSLAHAPAQKPWTCRDRGRRWRIARPAATTGHDITGGPYRAQVTTPPAQARASAPTSSQATTPPSAPATSRQDRRTRSRPGQPLASPTNSPSRPRAPTDPAISRTACDASWTTHLR